MTGSRVSSGVTNLCFIMLWMLDFKPHRSLFEHWLSNICFRALTFERRIFAFEHRLSTTNAECLRADRLSFNPCDRIATWLAGIPVTGGG